jgi:hypothetical protein
VTAVLPSGFDDIDLGELLDVIAALVGYLRVNTYDEQPRESDVKDRARCLLDRYRDAA